MNEETQTQNNFATLTGRTEATPIHQPEFFVVQNIAAGWYVHDAYDNTDGPTTFTTRKDAQEYANQMFADPTPFAVVRFGSHQGTPQPTEPQQWPTAAEFYVVQNTGIGYDGNGDNDRSYANAGGRPMTFATREDAQEFADDLNEGTFPGKYAVVRFSRLEYGTPTDTGREKRNHEK